jgi:CRP-like cAMP-binding protein
VPFLRPLPVPVVEQLAQGIRRTQLRPGEVVFNAGDTGDNFYVVADGTVHVLDQGRVVRTMVAGEGFGEIALMGNTTRTMTVRAVGAVELCGISSADFLSAVTSISDARSVAEATRLAHLAHAPGTDVATRDTS